MDKKNKKIFIASITRTWLESGEVAVEADDINGARELIREMLSEDSSKIQWNESNMSWQEDRIDEIKQKK